MIFINSHSYPQLKKVTRCFSNQMEKVFSVMVAINKFNNPFGIYFAFFRQENFVDEIQQNRIQQSRSRPFQKTITDIQHALLHINYELLNNRPAAG